MASKKILAYVDPFLLRIRSGNHCHYTMIERRKESRVRLVLREAKHTSNHFVNIFTTTKNTLSVSLGDGNNAVSMHTILKDKAEKIERMRHCERAGK